VAVVVPLGSFAMVMWEETAAVALGPQTVLVAVLMAPQILEAAEVVAMMLLAATAAPAS